MGSHGDSNRWRWIAGVLLACCILGILAVPVFAGDFPGLIEVTPDEVAAQPGDEVQVDVRMNSHGTYTGAGVARVAVTIAYDPAAIEVIDVERGPWLEQGNETEIASNSSIDNDAGNVTIEQVRTPPAGGATGDDLLAHIELRVRSDAPASEAVLAIDDPEIGLTNGEFQAPYLYDGMVVIDGGGEVLDPLAEETDDDPGVILADDANGTDGADDAANDGEDEDDPIPGFGGVLAILAIATALAVRRWQHVLP